MKRSVALWSTILVMSAIAAADTWTGTIVDVMCKNSDLASHTAKCAVECSKGGYGLVLGDGKFVKFNETGNAKALSALKATPKEKDLKAKVTGTLQGDIIKVQEIEIQ
jgi:hypothetical protein